MRSRRLASLVAAFGVLAATAATLVAPRPALAAPPQQVTVRVYGGYSYDHTGIDADGGVSVYRNGSIVTQVAGTAAFPGKTGGTAYATFAVNGLFGLPIYLGSVKVSDASAGINLDGVVFFGQVSAAGTSGATGSLNWFGFEAPFNFKPYTLNWSVGPAPAGNLPPTASFTAAPTSGTAPLAVAFDGSASSDPDGSIASYAWDFGDGATGSGATTTHTYTTAGTRTARLTVTDNLGATGTTTRTITVAAPPNQPPTAVLSASPTSGDGPLTVNADGSASSDPDGTIASYTWSWGDGAFSSGATASHSYDPGSYTLTLTVTDDDGATAIATQAISVGMPPLVPPTGLRKTGSGCCDTYGDFAWDAAVPYADAYEIYMDGFFGGGCLTDHSDVVAGPTTGRVQAVGLCLGSRYDVRIRARRGGVWSSWSPDVRITL